MQTICEHGVRLSGKTNRGIVVELRSLMEQDWDLLFRWNQDPEVLYYSEGDDVQGYTLEEIQGIYRSVSQAAFCFVIEVGGIPIGECWLQSMNLEQILEAYPERGCSRIDLMIGERAYWGQGIGTEVIRLLTEFGFKEEDADMIFACHVADYNLGSLKAFGKAGYNLILTEAVEPGKKAKCHHFLAMRREEWEQQGL